MHPVTPRVFLVGETRIVAEGLTAYLEHLGAPEWSSDGPTDAERLVEIMGRLCYRSFKPGLNPNVTKIREHNQDYLAHVLQVKHGSVIEHPVMNFIFADVSRVFCYTPDTEVLTEDGWAPLPEIGEGTMLLTLDPQTRFARWQPNRQLHRFDYTGPVHWIESSQWSSPAMTPEHLMWAAPYDVRRARSLTAAQNLDRYVTKLPLSTLLGRRFVVDHRITMAYGGEDPDTMKIGHFGYPADDFFRWLGLVATDGFVDANRNACVITQSKPDRLVEIRLLMNRLFAERWKEYAGPHEQRILRIHDASLKDFVVYHIGRIKPARNLAPMFRFSRRLLSTFLEGALMGDGSVQGSHQVLYCPSARVAAQWQVIVALLGRSSNVREVPPRQSHQLPHGIEIRSLSHTAVLSLHVDGVTLVKKYHQRTKHYTGPVYCPETADGVVYVRRKGMAFWSGNTHELVRHRAGVAISQESLRFVRLEDLGQWLPTVIREDLHAVEIFARTFEGLECLQHELAAHFQLDNPETAFSKKKTITSAMRRLAPIGLATTIGWSANPRTLRWVLEMRTDPAAEEEIRLVFGKVGEIVVERYPHLFGDFTVEIADGLPWYRPQHSKV